MLIFSSSAPAAPGAITDRPSTVKDPEGPRVMYSKQEYLHTFDTLALLCSVETQSQAN